jgi:arylsulfatase A-like enzyme
MTFFTRCFWGALASLVFVKCLLLGHQLFSSEGSWDGLRLLYLVPLVFGADVLGALLATLVAGLVAAPLLLLRRPLGARVLAAMTLGLLGAVGAMSTMGIMFAGGPLNRQGIESAMYGAMGSGLEGFGALAGSVGDYVNVVTLLGVAVAALLPVAFLFPLPGFLSLRGSTPTKSALSLGVLAGAVLATFLLLPPMQDGRLNRLPLSTQAEGSPLTDLLWSYTRPLLREVTTKPVGDPFRLDLTARYDHGPAAAPLASAQPKRTNVLLVMLESAGDSYLRTPDNPMPFLTSLETRPGAVRLANHYSTWALTTAAMFSVFCSELPYPSYKPLTVVNPNLPAFCLSEAFRRAGYATAYINSQDLLWDRLHLFFRSHPFDRLLDAASMPGRETAFFGKWGIDDAVSVDALLDLPELHAEKPFFVMFSMVSGHHPYFAYAGQDGTPAASRREEYFRSLSYADAQLKRLLEGLEQRGVLDDTLVLIVSDHGEGTGRNVGRNIYQAAVHVPALLLGPQLPRQASTVTLTTNHLDLAPTLLALLGLPIPCNLKGRNLLEDGTPRVAFFGSRPPKEQFGLVDGPWKYILENDRIGFLFNLEKDPEELLDLSPQHPELAEAFHQRILQWRTHTENLIEDYSNILHHSHCTP